MNDDNESHDECFQNESAKNVHCEMSLAKAEISLHHLKTLKEAIFLMLMRSFIVICMKKAQ